MAKVTIDRHLTGHELTRRKGPQRAAGIYGTVAAAS
jgi:hypothetical protein